MLTYGELTGHIQFDCPHCKNPAIIPVVSLDIVERDDTIGTEVTGIYPVKFQVVGLETKCPGCNKPVTITI